MSRLFAKNRALGYVSNHIPLCVRYIQRRKDNFVHTCVGNAFHTYSCGNLALISVSGCHPSDIQVLCGDYNLIYTACANEIFAWKRGFELKHVYRGHVRHVHLLLPFGKHLISVDEESNLIVWEIETEEVFLELNFQETQFSISAILHPSSYTNKVLLGSQKGDLQLWNLHASKLIYSFKGWGSSVLVLQQSPAIDVVAIGLASGQIILHNLKYDQTVVDFSQEWGPVTALAFRSDGPPFMVSGSPAGHIVVWDLEKRRVASQLRDAHAGAVTGLQCLPNEPVFVTSSPDNSLKTWIFDQPNDMARLLCVKEGHSLPPLMVRFHKSDGKNLVSSGGDSSLRVFSTVTERFNKSMGRATYNRNAMKRGKLLVSSVLMPPITMFASESARGKHWDDIICAHSGLSAVTTWSYEKLCMGSHKLLPPHVAVGKDRKSVVTSLCLSHCGNFAIIGYSSGHIHRFNMQSGLYRGMYGSLVAHDSPVRGLSTDNLNKVLVSGDATGIVKFWHFNPKLANVPLHELVLSEGISYFRSHDEASLLAVIMEDFSLCIIDQDTHNVVRKLDGHPNRITDAVFSPDARWLITASMDCLICVWDIPSGKPVEIFRMDRACTSLAFSPNGQYLATTHVDLLGIYLWSNRSLCSHVSLHPCPSPFASASILEGLPLVELPVAMGEGGVPQSEDDLDASLGDEGKEPEYVSPEQISENMVTYSSLAGSRWQNLLNIDIIRRKNKPIKPPEAPKSAPFFLPTIPSLEPQFDIKPDKNNEKEPMESHFYSTTIFGSFLLKSVETCDFAAVLEKLKSLGPTSIDYEVGSLSPENGGSIMLMLQFLKLIEYMFQSKRDYELSQAYLGLFLKVHGRTIAVNVHLREFSKKLQKAQEECWNALQEKIFFCLCVVQSLKTL